MIANAAQILAAEAARRAAAHYLASRRDILHRELYAAWRAELDPQAIADQLPGIKLATVRRAVLRNAEPEDYRAGCGVLWMPSASTATGAP
ncbi:hypothetical protein OG216_47480 (plasmid) [Streptomycetaceae bacterium NBC_01309]